MPSVHAHSAALFRLLCTALLVAVGAGHVGGQQVARLSDQPPPPTAAPNYSLVGLWVGVSYLDEEKLAAKYAQLTDPAQREALVKSAETFLSLAVAVNYQADGSIESDAEIVDGSGETIREATSGQWRVVESRELKLIIEIHERNAEGQTTTTRRLLQFYEDGEHLATPMETSELLADLNPLIVFERVPAEVAAEMKRAAQEQEAAASQGIDR